MTDDFATFQVRAQGQEVMFAAFGVWKYANDEMGLWERELCLSKLETLTVCRPKGGIKIERLLVKGTLTRRSVRRTARLRRLGRYPSFRRELDRSHKREEGNGTLPKTF